MVIASIFAGVVLAGDRFPSAACFMVAAIGLGGCSFAAGRATTTLLQQSALSRRVLYGGFLLGGIALAFGSAMIVPPVPLSAWMLLGLCAIAGMFLALTWWLVWLRYQEALRIGLGPVTSL